ncbi:MAG: hypothetical protein GY928_14580 [Colwellia sp.]|nr:hypothetical protein [Colwellia sp.]
MIDIDIKKALYKQNVDAEFNYIKNGVAFYYSDLEEQRVHFEIPVNDMGSASFNRRMQGKHLCRWIINK